MRSILGNFGFINKNVKDIEMEIRDDIDEYFIIFYLMVSRTKNSFSLQDMMNIINKKWF
jgi:hypothetical protein